MTGRQLRDGATVCARHTHARMHTPSWLAPVHTRYPCACAQTHTHIQYMHMHTPTLAPLRTHTYIHTETQGIHTLTHPHLQTRTHTFTHTGSHARPHTCTQMPTNSCSRVYTFTQIQSYPSPYMCPCTPSVLLHAHTYTLIWLCAHTHKYTYHC